MNELHHTDVSDVPDPIIEQTADMIHQFWWNWSAAIAAEEDISEERLERWQDCWRSYERLSEDMKDHDRERARTLWAVILRQTEA